ncbi:hypothetical protein [Conexibacter woesei]|uniref:hypothetical protein n=1 Tax=Conexibacter woesei TaxID=191495 RepID=UPI0011D25443|nr:hypothetical protein [Conexibacter woesei]
MLLLLLVLPAAHASAGTKVRHVAGWALLGPDQRIRGGLVEVWSMDGRSVLRGSADRTSGTGTFDVAVRRLPRRYVVSVRGGRVGDWRMRGVMGVVVRRGEAREKLHVTPLSTVIAARVGVHFSIARAEREIRTLFGLPRWHDLYGDVRHDSSAFDGGRFVRAAHQRGGLDRYVARIGRLVGKRRVSFRGAPTKARAQASLAIDPIEIARSIAGNAAEWGLGEFLSILGFKKDPTAAALREIKQQLERISAELVELRRAVDGLERQLAKANYNSAVSATALRWVGTDSDDVKQDLDWIVDNAIACKKGTGADCDTYVPEGANAARWCVNEFGALEDAWDGRRSLEPARATCTVLDKIDKRVLNNPGFNTWDTDVVGDGGTGGIVRTYLELATVGTREQGGFLTPAYRREAQLLVDQFKWKSLLLASYAAERARATRQPQSRVKALFATAGAQGLRQEALLPRRLPANTTIDLRGKRIWTLLDNPAKACGGAATGHRWLWRYGNDEAVPNQAACAAQWNAAAGSAIGSGGWGLPSEEQLTGVTQRVRGQSRAATLSGALTDVLGFDDLAVVSGAFTPPAPDSGRAIRLRALTLPNSWNGNGGTPAALATAGCRDRSWFLGWEYVEGLFDRRWANVFGTFCAFVRLSDGATLDYCVRSGLRWGERGYVGEPCNAPAAGAPVRDRGKQWTGPIPFAHPLLHLVQRPVADTEGWYRAP